MSERTKKLKESPIISRARLIELINNIDNLRDQALVAFLYLTGCRIEEVVKYIKTKNLNRMVKDKATGELISEPLTETIYAGDPIKKNQIVIKDKYIVINDVRTLKRKKYYPRKIPIPINDMEQPFIDVLLTYLKHIEPEEFLFNITRIRAWRIISKHGLHPHYLRHMRNTHLATQYQLTSSEIQKLNGWGVSSTADVYVHLDITDLINKMVRVDGGI